MKTLDSCVTPNGTFQYGIHKPAYAVTNLRQNSRVQSLGELTNTEGADQNEQIDNSRNYPLNNLKVDNADWIYEIPNAFPFRGRTYIDKEWADSSANNPDKIRLKTSPSLSLSTFLQEEGDITLFDKLPLPLCLALATCSTDPTDLVKLAHRSCEIIMNGQEPQGLRYEATSPTRYRPVIHDHALFEAVANNVYLPDSYKIVMVIRPGAQGASEIVGEFVESEKTHVFEYLRRNSYIPGGHYAANMADDAIRYSIEDLTPADIKGLRHLYYQRSFVRIAEDVKLDLSNQTSPLSETQLEQLRLDIIRCFTTTDYSPATLWGWNFGFDFAPSRYRLHASHQQIHQQYSMVPEKVERYENGCIEVKGELQTYSLGDQLSEFIKRYHSQHKSDFFTDYFRAIRTNTRMDEREDLQNSLVVWEDERVMVFVPKAQTSQWELQLTTLPRGASRPPGNILECDTATRKSLDSGILAAQKALAGLGAKMVTCIEYGKRINAKDNVTQPLLYAFLPRLPESPGAFSEAQLRFINGHYPEDFAQACRAQLSSMKFESILE